MTPTEDAARRAAEKIAAKLFAEVFHPAGEGGISIEMEKQLAAIILSELGSLQSERDSCQCIVWAKHGVAHPRGHVESGCAFAASERDAGLEEAAQIAERHDRTHGSGYRCYEGEVIAEAIRARITSPDGEEK